MKVTNKAKGLVLSFILSLIVIITFFGKIINDPNNYYFAPNGDGFKAYFGAMYHLQHDSTSMRMNGMNYPFGEMVFFTGSQPLVVNTVKFISNNIVDIGDNIVGIMNLLMIFSIVVAAIFIFLIFNELDISWWYGSIVAVGICMISPQIARFGGHYSLSYLFWIPLMIYMVMVYNKKRSLWVSLVIAFITFIAGGMHLYFVGFFGFIIGFYWLDVFLRNIKDKKKWLTIVMNFCIQFIIPVLAIQLLITLNDNVADRTTHPYGFFVYKAHPLGVFLPNARPYSFVPRILTVFRHIGWESYAFIGLAALSGFAVGTVKLFTNIFRKRIFYKVIDVPVLNTLFWASFVALLFSFGLPFIAGFEFLVDKLGSIRQLRALARFSWFFFYILNIVVFYQVYQTAFLKKKSLVYKVILALALFFLLFEGTYHISLESRRLQNRFIELEDRQNKTPANKWVHQINPEDYQAIIPVPYYHIGSENIWVESKNNSTETSMLVALKTGLPLTGTQLSRTSISQSYMSYSMMTEPLNEFELLKKLPDTKDFLVCVSKGGAWINNDEQRIIDNSDLITQNDRMELRRISVEKLRQIQKTYVAELGGKFIAGNPYLVNGVSLPDTVSYFKRINYNKLPSEVTYEGNGALNFPARQWQPLFTDTINYKTIGEKYLISFWFYNYKKDANIRHNLEWIQKDTASDKVTTYLYSDIHRHIRAFDGDWVLIEFSFESKALIESVSLKLRNKVLKSANFTIDELIVRREGSDVFYSSEKYNFINGRKLKPRQQ